MDKTQMEAIISIHFSSEEKWVKKNLEKNFPELFSKRKAIVEEAIKRGFVRRAIIDNKGIKHRSVGDSNYFYMLESHQGFKYYQSEDLLQYGSNEATIYCNGVWAEIKNKDEVKVSQVLNI